MKGFIVRKSQKTVFVRSTATDEEIEFVKDNYGRLGWLILPCKNEGKEKPKTTKRKPIEVDETLNIPYDKILKEEVLAYAQKYLTQEEKIEFIKEAYTIKKDKKGNEKPSYRHIKAKDFIFKTKFADRFEKVENRRSSKASKEKCELSQEDIDILSILKA